MAPSHLPFNVLYFHGRPVDDPIRKIRSLLFRIIVAFQDSSTATAPVTVATVAAIATRLNGDMSSNHPHDNRAFIIIPFI